MLAVGLAVWAVVSVAAVAGWILNSRQMETVPIPQIVSNNVLPTKPKELAVSFDYHSPEGLTLDRNVGEVEMLATGDIMLGRSVNAKTEQLKNYTYPLEKMAQYLRTADIAFINLEGPLVIGCKPTQVGMTFCGNPRNVEGLAFAGIDVVNISNNHIDNYGQAGVDETISLLNQNGIAISGKGETAILTVKGMKFGLLGYNDVPATLKIDDIRYEIGELKKKTDVVVVAMHWGIEYRADPVDRQRELGHAAIDAGADLVIGNHPHWVEATEVYNGKLITYAHGNFVFDQTWSRETQEGVVGKYVFAGKKLIGVSFYPIIVAGDYQPRWATEAEAAPILTRMRTATEKLLK